MKFVIEIEVGNEKMNTPRHVVKALKDIVDNLQLGYYFPQDLIIRDINGNKVGTWGMRDG